MERYHPLQFTLKNNYCGILQYLLYLSEMNCVRYKRSQMKQYKDQQQRFWACRFYAGC